MRKKRFVALLLALALLLCACGAAKTPLEQAAAYLKKAAPNPGYGSLNGDWTVFGLARSGVQVAGKYYETYYGNVEAAVTEAGGKLSETKYTEYSRLVLALTAIGRDPRDVGGYDLLVPLADLERVAMQGVNGSIYALLALDSAGYAIPQNPDAAVQATREGYVDEILSRQNPDGGWANTTGNSDLDTTAMALTALAAYRQDSTDYFTAWVHQIKTPLSVMRLQLQSEDTPENRAMLAELFQMEQYVTMALSYARLGNPTKDLVLTRVPLDPVIRQAIRDFAPLLIRKKLRLQYEPTAESALTDSKWLLFILHQLLSNAVKYTDRGRVSIRVTSAPAIIVADTGIGIAPEDVPRVFEKGYTGYNGRGGQKSTGLGLYLVHQTAEMLHCRVSLSSRIGEGTSVTIDLHQEELGKE